MLIASAKPERTRQSNMAQDLVSSAERKMRKTCIICGWLSCDSSAASRTAKTSRRLLRRMQPWFRLRRGMTLGVRAAVFDNQNRVFLVRHSYAPGWLFPGGGVERGETIYDAVAR